MQSSARKSKSKPIVFAKNISREGDVKLDYSPEYSIDALDEVQKSNEKRLAEKYKYVEILKVRLTRAQKAYIRSIAHRTRLTQSAVIRLALFASKEPQYDWLSILEKKEKPKVSNADPKKLHDVKVELKRIGTNLNQLTRLANSGKINNKELIRLLEDVKESNLQTQEVLGCVVRGNKRGR